VGRHSCRMRRRTHKKLYKKKQQGKKGRGKKKRKNKKDAILTGCDKLVQKNGENQFSGGGNEAPARVHWVGWHLPCPFPPPPWMGAGLERMAERRQVRLTRQGDHVGNRRAGIGFQKRAVQAAKEGSSEREKPDEQIEQNGKTPNKGIKGAKKGRKQWVPTGK